jgi:hypothetical protein
MVLIKLGFYKTFLLVKVDFFLKKSRGELRGEVCS